MVLLTRSSNFFMYNPHKVNLGKVVVKSLLLGAVFGSNLVLLSITPALYRPLHAYVSLSVVFHLLEFLITSWYNEDNVDDDSFILEDNEIHLINLGAVAEFLVRSRFWGPNVPVAVCGLAVALVGQAVRSGAMVNAGESFNHYVQRSRGEKHKLVTTGLYGYLRHPSYFGFFWWFVGTQVLLNNVAVLAVGCVILSRFFARRIEYEEEYLVRFFGEYGEYRGRVGVWMPLWSFTSEQR